MLQGLLPVPFFINGVEAHTIVRDLLTTTHEQSMRAKGVVQCDSLRQSDAVTVDAIVNTIGKQPSADCVIAKRVTCFVLI